MGTWLRRKYFRFVENFIFKAITAAVTGTLRRRWFTTSHRKTKFIYYFRFICTRRLRERKANTIARDDSYKPTVYIVICRSSSSSYYLWSFGAREIAFSSRRSEIVEKRVYKHVPFFISFVLFLSLPKVNERENSRFLEISAENNGQNRFWVRRRISFRIIKRVFGVIIIFGRVAVYRCGVTACRTRDNPFRSLVGRVPQLSRNDSTRCKQTVDVFGRREKKIWLSPRSGVADRTHTHEDCWVYSVSPIPFAVVYLDFRFIVNTSQTRMN